MYICIFVAFLKFFPLKLTIFKMLQLMQTDANQMLTTTVFMYTHSIAENYFGFQSQVPSDIGSGFCILG